MTKKIIRTNVELSADVRAMLGRLAKDELRTLKAELTFMIKQRYYERYGQMIGPAPQPTEAE